MNCSFTLPMIADGTGSCSEISGDDPDNVCSEITILNSDDKLITAKKRFVSCGADALLSPTEGISHSRLEDLGCDEDFSQFLGELTEKTVSCSEGRPVGGVLCKSDPIASEYGKNVFESAFFDHLEKITILKNSGASFILLRNFDKLWDMRAGVLAAETADIPVFVLIRVDEEGKTDSDTDYIAALITLQALGASAFGIECTSGAEETAELIHKAFPHAEIPLIAASDLSSLDKKEISALSEAGASVFIDLSPSPDKDKLSFLKSLEAQFSPDTEKDSYAAAIYREAFFLPENLELSEPIDCGYDMSDEIIDLDDSPANVILFNLGSTDDASFIAENAEMSSLPFIIHANDTTTLEAALRYYQGRLIVDTNCDIETDELKKLALKYGAVLY